MNTPRREPIPSRSRSASKEWSWRPNALRSALTSSTPRWSRSSRIRPAQVPSTGLPLPANARSGSRESLALHAERHGGGLAAGDHQAVEALKLLARAHRPRLGAELAKHVHVRLEVALEGEDPDYGVGAQPAKPAASANHGVGAQPAGRAHQPRFWSRPPPPGASSVPISSPAIGSPRSRDAAATRSGSWKCVVASTIARARALGVGRLEDARAHEVALGTELHHQRGVGRGGDAAGAEEDHGQPALPGHLAHQLERSLELLGRGWELHAVEGGQPPDLAGDQPDVAHGLDHVAGASLALGPDHGRALGDPPQGLAQVGGAAHERHLEVVLVDVVRLVRGGEHLGLVDVVDVERLEHLRLGEVADPRLGHHRDASRRP